MELQATRKNLVGKGGKEEGTSHFLHQRLTGAANVPLMMFLIWLIMNLASANRIEMVALISNPVLSILLVLAIISACWHMALGLQVVIEDYVPNVSLRERLVKVNYLFSIGVGLVSLFSVIKLSFRV